VELTGKSVLDYGSGDGTFSFELARKGAVVEGIDISDSVVDVAAQSVPKEITRPRFSVRDAHATGFDDCSFDYIFGNGILHHLELERAYREIARILKPGGKAFFMEPLEHHPLLMLVRKVSPAARSADEKPLNVPEIALAKHFFDNVKSTEHFIFAVAAAPIHFLSNEMAFWLIKGLDRLDQSIIKMVPAFGRYAWLSMLEFQKHRNGVRN